VEARVLYLQYCEDVATSLLDRSDVSVKVKEDQILNLGRETVRHLKICGVSDESLRLAKRYALFAHRLVQQLSVDSSPVLRGLLKKIQEVDHSVGTVMIVVILLEGMNYVDEEVISLITTAGFLHDIGLYLLPEDYSGIREEDLNEKQWADYEKHPALGAEVVASLTSVNPLIPQVILQHHERRNRKGFPRQMGSGQISPISEIIGISDLFQDLLAKSGGPFGKSPLEAMEERYFDGFSFATIEGFRKAFLRRPPGGKG
jgi:response regulator RpfG family c-di-GMP phosphodiesterase